MPKVEHIQKTINYICDKCQAEIIDNKELISVSVASHNGLRLLQKIQQGYTYEAFEIPDRKELYFCSNDCARSYLFSDLELFLAEIKPISKGRSRPL